MRRSIHGFTLLEVLVASLGAAILLVAIYGIFGRAVRLRDQAMERTREAEVITYAVDVIRDDLRNAAVTGGLMADGMSGALEGPESRFPGYLRFPTTTGVVSDHEPFGDLQEVEYLIVNDPNAEGRPGGLLVRVVDRILLAPVRDPMHQEVLLRNVEALEIRFFDGANWVDPWEVVELNRSLPEAISVRIKRGPTGKNQERPPPLEIVAPWPSQPTLTPQNLLLLGGAHKLQGDGS